MFWQKEEDKSRWSEIARDCLAVGTIVKIIWDWHLPDTVAFPLLFGMMFTSLFGITRDLIAILAFLIFVAFFTISYPAQGAVLIIAFILYTVVVKIFRRRYF